MAKDKLRIKFCPTCKSFNVRYIHKLRNLLGVIPMMKCLDCGAEMSSFPIMEVSRKELDKKNKELEKKKVGVKNERK